MEGGQGGGGSTCSDSKGGGAEWFSVFSFLCIPFKMSDASWCCNKVFLQVKPKMFRMTMLCIYSMYFIICHIMNIRLQ